MEIKKQKEIMDKLETVNKQVRILTKWILEDIVDKGEITFYSTQIIEDIKINLDKLKEVL